jgi:hypothetical protein
MSKQITHQKVTEARLRAFIRDELSAAESEAIAEIVRNSYFYGKVLEGIEAELNAGMKAAEKPGVQEGFLDRRLKSFFRQGKKLLGQSQECFGVKKSKTLQLAI